MTEYTCGNCFYFSKPIHSTDIACAIRPSHCLNAYTPICGGQNFEYAQEIEVPVYARALTEEQIAAMQTREELERARNLRRPTLASLIDAEITISHTSEVFTGPWADYPINPVTTYIFQDYLVEEEYEEMGYKVIIMDLRGYILNETYTSIDDGWIFDAKGALVEYLLQVEFPLV